jgi:hypothetical protein
MTRPPPARAPQWQANVIDPHGYGVPRVAQQILRVTHVQQAIQPDRVAQQMHHPSLQRWVAAGAPPPGNQRIERGAAFIGPTRAGAAMIR